MFKPISLQAKNACQHRDITLPFTAGITVVNGKNGSGKSNMTHVLLYFAITGETPPKSGCTKKELLNWMSKSGHTCMTFSYNDTVYSVTRYLHNSKVKLESADGTVKKEQAEANAFMDEVIGMPAQAFYKTCFAPQQKLTQIIKMTHGDRMTYFQQLFGTEKAEKVRGLIKTYQDILPNYPDRTYQVQECEETIVRLDKSLAEVSVQVAAYVNSLAEHDAAAPAMDKILALPSFFTYAGNVTAAENTLANDTLLLQQAQAANNLEAPVFTGTAPDPTGAFKENRQIRLIANKRYRATLVHNMEQRVEPSDVEEVLDRTILDEIKVQLAGKAALCKLAREGTCPTCSRPHTLEVPAEQVIAEYDALAQRIQSEEAAYSKALYEQQVKTAALAQWRAEVAGDEKKLAEYDVAIAEDDIPDIVNFDAGVWKQQSMAKVEYEDSMRIYNQGMQKIQASTDAVTASTANLEHAKTAPYSSDEAVAQANVFRTQHNTVRSTLSNLKANQASMSAEKDGVLARMAEYAEEQEKRARVIGTIEKFEKARLLLHKNNLQRQVMVKALGSLNMVIDEYLGHFGKDYTAWIDEAFDFRASKPDNNDFRAGLLSGGEQMALCMAYMLAIAEVKGSNIPIMVLDEPTDGLDTEAMNGLIEVLKIARGYAEKGLYVIIPSHAPEMEAAKSQMINMETL
jgi:DNA repair exonuclease SbcCD ATPase subunit